ncbi:hypothetical protein GGI22_000988 [Coemansia erecta]|nr:hypothetical protein GGI22_000988 [Coemansia erecta]
MYKSSCPCCCSNLAPQPPSNPTSTQYHHSRSSSASTIVATSPMLVPRMSQPSSVDSIASSPYTGPAVAIAIHSNISPHKGFLLSSSPPHDSGVGIPDMLQSARDVSDDVSNCSDDEIDGSLFGDDFDDDDQQPIFDMDADKLSPGVARSPSVRFQVLKALDPADLTYHHTTKPQPWAVRPLDVYNSHRAQLRAIDDDDNAFYPS